MRNHKSKEVLKGPFGVTWTTSANTELFDKSRPFREIFGSSWTLFQLEESINLMRFEDPPNATKKVRTVLINSETGKIIPIRTNYYYLGLGKNFNLFTIVNNFSDNETKFYSQEK